MIDEVTACMHSIALDHDQFIMTTGRNCMFTLQCKDRKYHLSYFHMCRLTIKYDISAHLFQQQGNTRKLAEIS